MEVVMKINVKRAFSMVWTHEGAPARTITDVQRLRRLVLPCLLWEDAFYVDGKTIAEQIRDGVAAVPADVAAAIAVEAREQFHLRHAPLWIVREMARRHAGSALVGDTLARVIARPDEIGEFVALYWKDKREPLSAQAKKGLAKAFAKFDRYQLAKYAKGGAVRLRDVMFLTHPKPAEDAVGVFREIADDAISRRTPARGRRASPRARTSGKPSATCCARASSATWRCCATCAPWSRSAWMRLSSATPSSPATAPSGCCRSATWRRRARCRGSSR
jgi:hypothetical protein